MYFSALTYSHLQKYISVETPCCPGVNLWPDIGKVLSISEVHPVSACHCHFYKNVLFIIHAISFRFLRPILNIARCR